MSKETRAHVPSVLAGLGLGALFQLGALQPRSPASFQAPALRFGPHPRDFVRIVEESPFTVPDGSFFVPTALGGTGTYPSTTFTLRADGAAVAGVAQGVSPTDFDTGSIRSLPRAAALPAGATISVSGGINGVNDARAWGYVLALPPDALDSVTPLVEYGPGPEDMHAAQSVVVPADKLFVVTAIGSAEPTFNGSFVLSADGEVELRASTPSTASMIPVPRGLVFGPGTVVTSSASAGVARMWGYFADA
jgi:hypothetical protein